MYYTIYKVTNKITNKFYIGAHQTSDLNDGYMGSGLTLAHAIQKHGLENFEKEILFLLDSAEEMYRKEASIVDESFVSNQNTYNAKVGGKGGWEHVHSADIDWSKILKRQYESGARTPSTSTGQANARFQELLKTDKKFRDNIRRKRSAEIQEQIRRQGHPCLGRRRMWVNDGATERLVKLDTDYSPPWRKGRLRR